MVLSVAQRAVLLPVLLLVCIVFETADTFTLTLSSSSAPRIGRTARSGTALRRGLEKKVSPTALHMALSESEKREKDSKQKLNKGFRILELAGVVPQGGLVKVARFAWKQIWLLMMQELAPQTKSGAYARPTNAFSTSISSKEDFPSESGRYHVYVGNACPWCHRVLLALKARGLTDDISYSVLLDDPEKASRGGWAFSEERPDPAFGCKDLREVYELCSPGYEGRCTAPLVVDKKLRRLVSNESSDIMRALNAFEPPSRTKTEKAPESSNKEDKQQEVDLCPPALETSVDDTNAWVYELLNNGVYRSGFSTSQSAYEAAVSDVFTGWARCEALLEGTRFLCGDKLTEADLRLFPTAVRFDAVYASLFKCTKRPLSSYPHLSAWLRDVYQLPGMAETVDLEDCRRSYFKQLFPLNPGGIIPIAPTVDDLGLTEPHGRGSNDRSAVFHLK